MEENLLSHVQTVSEYLAIRMRTFSNNKHIWNIRTLGMVAAFDLFADAPTRQKFDSNQRAGYKVYLEALKNGLILRLLGDTVYYWLPLCTTVERFMISSNAQKKVLQKTLDTLNSF